MQSRITFMGIPMGWLDRHIDEAEARLRAEWEQRSAIRQKIIDLPLSPQDRIYYLSSIDQIPRRGYLFKHLSEMVLGEAKAVAERHPFSLPNG